MERKHGLSGGYFYLEMGVALVEIALLANFGKMIVLATSIALLSLCRAGAFCVGPCISTVATFSSWTAILGLRPVRLLLHGTVSRHKICCVP